MKRYQLVFSYKEDVSESGAKRTKKTVTKKEVYNLDGHHDGGIFVFWRENSKAIFALAPEDYKCLDLYFAGYAKELYDAQVDVFLDDELVTSFSMDVFSGDHSCNCLSDNGGHRYSDLLRLLKCLKTV